jgi:hypothetical protein
MSDDESDGSTEEEEGVEIADLVDGMAEAEIASDAEISEPEVEVEEPNAPTADEATEDEPSEEIADNAEVLSEIIIVDPDKRKGPQMMSLFEITEHITIRAAQIEKYNDCMVSGMQLKMDISKISDPIILAKYELSCRMSPLKLHRKVGEIIKNGIVYQYVEIWDPNVMEFPIALI